MSVVVVTVKTTHVLEHEKNRRYVFNVFPSGDVQVQRYANKLLEYRRMLTCEGARRLYAWLLKCGYHRW